MENHKVDPTSGAAPSSAAMEWETPDFAVLNISKATMFGAGVGSDGGGIGDSFSIHDDAFS